MKRNRGILFILSVFCLVASQLTAQHTFSIVAVDPTTGEVGSAGATCLFSSQCGGCGGAVIISDLVPGRGAVNSQATVCLPNSNLQSAIAFMEQGKSPQEILDNRLTFDACQFGDTSDRQYGIADLDSMGMPRAAAFTGSNTQSFAGHRVGPDYAIQGNILLGAHVLDSMEAGWLGSAGEPLCERLMAALQGANIPGADSRCLAEGTSSRSSFVRVARPGDTLGTFWMDLIVDNGAGQEPIDSLQTLFDQFKLLNGLPGTEREFPILLYPNPTDGLITLDVSEIRRVSPRVRIFNAMGQRMADYSFSATEESYQFDVSHMGSVLFVVYEDDETGIRTVKRVTRLH